MNIFSSLFVILLAIVLPVIYALPLFTKSLISAPLPNVNIPLLVTSSTITFPTTVIVFVFETSPEAVNVPPTLTLPSLVKFAADTEPVTSSVLDVVIFPATFKSFLTVNVSVFLTSTATLRLPLTLICLLLMILFASALPDIKTVFSFVKL